MIAIDPGALGCIVYDTPDGIFIERMPMMKRGNDNIVDVDELQEIIMSAHYCGNLICWIEDVGEHRQGNNAQTSATFAYNCGATWATVKVCGCSAEFVSPKVWQKSLGITWPEKEPKPAVESEMNRRRRLAREKTKRKRAIVEKMKELYPNLKVIGDTADALGIYTWAKRQL